MNILCPIDFTRASLAALKIAIQMAGERKQGVIVLYSFRLIHPPDGQSILSFKRSMEKMANEKFGELEKQFQNGRMVDHRFLVEVGFFSDSIASQVKANQVSMVVLDKALYDSIGEHGPTLDELLYPQRIPVLIVAENDLIHE